MNKLLGMMCAVACILGFAALVSGTEAGIQGCQQVMDNSCTRCHGIQPICKAMGTADSNWPAIVADMGKRGKLSQEVQNQALNCLTNSKAALEDALCPRM